MKFTQLIMMLLLVMLLAACGAETPPEPEVPENGGQPPAEETQEPAEEPVVEPEEPEEPEEPAIEESDPYIFFMKDGTTAHFRGDGNEYAQLTVRTVFLEENHIAVYEDNGGTTILKVFRIADSAADLVLEKPEFYEEYNPPLEELKSLQPISRYFELPIEAGDKVDGLEVVEIDVAAETPYANFENAIMTEKLEDDGATIRNYYVEGLGEVKREFIMGEGADEFRVTSSLESIE
ncbi:hypothetical protein [Planococcus koreensis]|uniref:hypothetical protein n=1 Tax=Planococcus koreensis TaxID=112331 RepID=UPI0039FC4393